MPTVAFHTLGCKVNQVETEALADLFRKNGYQVVNFEQTADVFVINTCTVTNIGDRKSRQMIRRAAAHPEAVVVVTGCYAQTEAAEVAAIPGVDLVVGTQGRESLVEMVQGIRKGGRSRVEVHDFTGQFEDLPSGAHSGRTRAVLKIQEGCRQFCSYCKVPYARGPLRSMPAENVKRRVFEQITLGYKEIVLAGVHLGLYGCENGNPPALSALVSELLAIPDLPRLRLSSLEPMDVDEKLISLFGRDSALCPHVHLPLQSGEDTILRRMNRPYSTGDFRRLVDRLRAARPDIAITTDLIVGFPGETAVQADTTLRFCEEMVFSRMHVFKFSPRRGTPAARMPEAVPGHIKDERSRAVRALAETMAGRFHRSFIGQHVDVLVEELDEDQVAVGLTPHYVKTGFHDGNGAVNRVCRVLATHGDKQGLWGKITAESSSTAQSDSTTESHSPGGKTPGKVE